jgi:hypothetical protein
MSGLSWSLFSGFSLALPSHSAEVFTLSLPLPPDRRVRMVLGEQVSIPCVASNTQRALHEDNAHSKSSARLMSWIKGQHLKIETGELSG